MNARACCSSGRRPRGSTVGPRAVGASASRRSRRRAARATAAPARDERRRGGLADPRRGAVYRGVRPRGWSAIGPAILPGVSAAQHPRDALTATSTSRPWWSRSSRGHAAALERVDRLHDAAGLRGHVLRFSSPSAFSPPPPPSFPPSLQSSTLPVSPHRTVGARSATDHRRHHALLAEPPDSGAAARCAGYGTRMWAGSSTTHRGRRREARARPARGPRHAGISRLFPPWVSLGLLIPFALGWALTGRGPGGLAALFWGARAGLPRPPRDLLDQLDLPLLRPAPASHRRRVDQRVLAAIPSLGESWHHNHHAFPRSARAEVVGGGPGRLGDPAMQRLGLAWNVVLITKERQQ